MPLGYFNRIARECPPGRTLRQLAMLEFLSVAGHAEPKQLAEAIGIQKPVVTRATSTLAEEGLVLRRPHPTDLRRCYVAITDKGRAEVRAVMSKAEGR